MTAWALHHAARCQARAYAVAKESIDAEGALIAAAAANVEAPLFPVLDLQIVSNDSGNQLVEVGAAVVAELQNDFVHGARQEKLPRPKHTNYS